MTLLNWDRFEIKDADGQATTRRFDGAMFERLVRRLLEMHFEGDWEPTARSWDGGKDFVDRSIPSATAWAECKMYRRPLPLKAISNTLVMAIAVGQGERLIFFSYSEMIERAREHLAKFSEATNRTVQVFDAGMLDELILKTPAAFHEFFAGRTDRPDQFQPRPVRHEKGVRHRTRFIAESDIDANQLADTSEKPVSQPFPLVLGQESVLQTVIYSREASKVIKINIDLNEVLKDTGVYRILNRSQLTPRSVHDLHPGGVAILKIIIEPSVTEPFTIPSIPLSIDGRQFADVGAQRFSVARFARPPLLVGRVHDALDELDKRTRGSAFRQSFTVFGRSGTGKSRFIEEARRRMLSNGLDVHVLDGQQAYADGFERFAATLLARLWRQPDPLELRPDDRAQPSLDNSEHDRIYARLQRAIYGTASSDDDSETQDDTILRFALSAFEQTASALLVDNVQALDTRSVFLLRRLDEALQGRTGRGAVLLAFNEDDLALSEAAAGLLHDRERAAAEKGVGAAWKLTDFEPDHVREFLNAMIAIRQSAGTTQFTERYPRTADLIIEKILPLPLDLFQAVMLAFDSGAVGQAGSLFEVVDVEKFHQLISGLQPKTLAVIEKRWSLLRKEPGVVRTLLVLALLGEARPSQLRAYGCADRDLDTLILRGLLRRRSGGQIQYYHPSIAGYFTERLLASDAAVLDSANVDDLRRRLFEATAPDPDPLALVSLDLFVGSPDADTLDQAFGRFAKLAASPPGWRSTSVARLLLDHIDSSGSPSILGRSVGVLETLCRHANPIDVASFTARLVSYVGPLSRLDPRDTTTFRGVFSVQRQAASYSQVCRKPSQGLAILAEARKSLRRLRGAVTTTERARVLADLFDRESVCLKSLGRLSDALKAGERAYRIAVRWNHHDLACLAKIDIGYIYYGPISKRQDLVGHWQDAAEEYARHASKIAARSRDTELACRLIVATVRYLCGDAKAAICEIETMIAVARSRGHTYYAVQATLLKALFLLNPLGNAGLPAQERRNQALTLKYYVEDQCILAQLGKFLPTARFMAARLLQADGKTAEARDYYASALRAVREDDLSPMIPANASVRALVQSVLAFQDSTEATSSILPPELSAAADREGVQAALDEAVRTVFSNDVVNFPCP